MAASGAEIGQGHLTMLAQIVGEQFGGDMDNIVVHDADTGATSLGIGTSNSRLACMAGTSAHVAAIKVRDKALKMAAHMLEGSADDLETDCISNMQATPFFISLTGPTP